MDMCKYMYICQHLWISIHEYIYVYSVDYLTNDDIHTHVQIKWLLHLILIYPPFLHQPLHNPPSRFIWFIYAHIYRSQANLLRAQCNLPAYEVIYDPLDASVIVSKLGGGALGQQLGFSRSGEEEICILLYEYMCILLVVWILIGQRLKHLY